MKRHVVETWLLYKFVSSVRNHKEKVSDNDELYYHCLDELEKAGLYSSKTGKLKEFHKWMKKSQRLEWVSCLASDMMETIGDGSNDGDMSNIYLENDKGSNRCGWTMVGQFYEDLALAYTALRRFVEGR